MERAGVVRGDHEYGAAADPRGSFVRNAGRSTLIRFVHAGWGRGEAWDEARAWQERAWCGAFAGLGKYLAGSPLPKPQILQ